MTNHKFKIVKEHDVPTFNSLKSKKSCIVALLLGKKGFDFLKGISNDYIGLIDYVVIGQDAGVQNDYFDEIVDLCDLRGLNWIPRHEYVDAKEMYVFAIGWRWMVKHPWDRLIVFHDSILPKYRGFNPLVTALINGDNAVGVTALLGADKYDRGDILAQSVIEVQYPVKIWDAINLLSSCYTKCGEKIFKCILSGDDLKGVSQLDKSATYSVWRDDEDYHLDWSGSAEKICRFIDAVGYPYRCAYSYVGDNIIRVLDASVIDDLLIENRDPGKVLYFDEGRPVVICGSGLLRVNNAVWDSDGTLSPVNDYKKFRMRFK